jgi:hypothetical protein
MFMRQMSTRRQVLFSRMPFATVFSPCEEILEDFSDSHKHSDSLGVLSSFGDRVCEKNRALILGSVIDRIRGAISAAFLKTLTPPRANTPGFSLVPGGMWTSITMRISMPLLTYDLPIDMVIGGF